MGDGSVKFLKDSTNVVVLRKRERWRSARHRDLANGYKPPQGYCYAAAAYRYSYNRAGHVPLIRRIRRPWKQHQRAIDGQA